MRLPNPTRLSKILWVAAFMLGSACSSMSTSASLDAAADAPQAVNDGPFATDAPSASDGGPARCQEGYRSRDLGVFCWDPMFAGDDPPTTDAVTVTEWRAGGRDCQPSAAVSSIADAGTASDYVLRVRLSDGNERSFGLSTPGLEPHITVGAKLTLTVSPGFGMLGQAQVEGFELRDSAGLVLYLGDGRGPDRLAHPDDVTIDLGSVVCPIEDSCGPVSRYRLAVSVAGTSGEVAPGERTRLGTYEVGVSEATQATTAMTQCEDWFPDEIAVGIARL